MFKKYYIGIKPGFNLIRSYEIELASFGMVKASDTLYVGRLNEAGLELFSNAEYISHIEESLDEYPDSRI